MKKILLSVFTLLITLATVHSQLLVSNDFSDETLGDFISIDNDGLTVNSNVSAFQGGFVPLQLNDGNWIAGATSWFTPAGTADNWLIN